MRDDLGLIRVAAFSPRVYVGNPDKNKEEILKACNTAYEHDTDIAVFPELSLTGYTCADLFGQSNLLNSAKYNLLSLAAEAPSDMLVFVGLPLEYEDILYNVAAALYGGEVIGFVPKKYIPNYKEFYEYRWFHGWNKEGVLSVDEAGFHCPIGNLLFEERLGAKIGVEICEDLWVPVPPSSLLSLSGAQIIVNLSASNELIAKADYRRELVKNQSGRCIGAYIYAGAGPSESTTDLVFGGHSIIAENGSIIKETEQIGNNAIYADLDYQKLKMERIKNRSFAQQSNYASTCQIVYIQFRNSVKSFILNEPSPTPFIPSNKEKLDERCKEIFDIQVNGLTKRLVDNNIKRLHIGISGGLDSTLALLVGKLAFEKLGRDLKDITGYSLPGFGTSDKTKNNAQLLMTLCGIKIKTVDIKTPCFDMFKSIGHNPFGININTINSVEELQTKITEMPEGLLHDATFENVQARMRTLVLMSNGFVLGTGDLSELALGWCTYNADHMSMYNPNCSIPKTLVKFLVNWYAHYLSNHYTELQAVLLDIVATEISPELLPVCNGKIQSTEETIGPYELNDFFLFYMLRYGFSPYKIFELAKVAFINVDKIHRMAKKQNKPYGDYIQHILNSFYKRFFTTQFKRSCVPDGPKVGSVSLSPRGDWRMPSDADADLWLKETSCDLERIEN